MSRCLRSGATIDTSYKHYQYSLVNGWQHFLPNFGKDVQRLCHSSPILLDSFAVSPVHFCISSFLFKINHIMSLGRDSKSFQKCYFFLKTRSPRSLTLIARQLDFPRKGVPRRDWIFRHFPFIPSRISRPGHNSTLYIILDIVWICCVRDWFCSCIFLNFRRFKENVAELV